MGQREPYTPPRYPFTDEQWAHLKAAVAKVRDACEGDQLLILDPVEARALRQLIHHLGKEASAMAKATTSTTEPEMAEVELRSSLAADKGRPGLLMRKHLDGPHQGKYEVLLPARTVPDPRGQAKFKRQRSETRYLRANQFKRLD